MHPQRSVNRKESCFESFSAPCAHVRERRAGTSTAFLMCSEHLDTLCKLRYCKVTQIWIIYVNGIAKRCSHLFTVQQCALFDNILDYLAFILILWLDIWIIHLNSFWTRRVELVCVTSLLSSLRFHRWSKSTASKSMDLTHVWGKWRKAAEVLVLIWHASLQHSRKVLSVGRKRPRTLCRPLRLKSQASSKNLCKRVLTFQRKGHKNFKPWLLWNLHSRMKTSDNCLWSLRAGTGLI